MHTAEAKYVTRFARLPGATRESGYLLLQSLGALVIFGAISVGYGRYALDRHTADINDSAAEHDIQVQNGVNKYISEQRVNLIKGLAIAQVANPMAPTLAELAPSLPLALGQVSYLPPGYDNANVLGYRYTVALTRLPAGCTPAVDCTDVTGVMTSDAAVFDQGNLKADGVRVASIATIIGADAAYSLEDACNGAVFNSIEGSNCPLPSVATPWSGVANSRGAVPGILAIRVGFGARGYDSLDHLLPRDGSRPMLNDLPMGGFSIKNVVDFDGTGKIKGQELITPTVVVNTPCADAGAIAGGKSITGNDVVMICNSATGLWKQDGTIAAPGAACTQPGLIASSSLTNEQLICRGTVYVKTTSLLNSIVEVDRLKVVDGQTVPIPVCDVGGTAFYHFSLNQIAIDVTIAPARQGMYVNAALDGAGNYTISLKLVDSGGGETSGNAYNLFALMHLECRYP